MWHSTGIGIKDPSRVGVLIKSRQVANIADNQAYFRVYCHEEYQTVKEFMEKNFELFSDNEWEDLPSEYPHQIEVDFGSKWGFPIKEFNQFTNDNSEISWNATTCEPGFGHRSLAWYRPDSGDTWWDRCPIETKGINL